MKTLFVPLGVLNSRYRNEYVVVLLLWCCLIPVQAGACTTYLENDSVFGRYNIGDETFKDLRTKLMWTRCVNGFSGADCMSGSRSLVTWNVAMSRAAASEIGGYTDWRLPNIKELVSLSLGSCGKGPSWDSQAIPNIPWGTFWSSTPYLADDTRVWMVTAGSGTTNHIGRAGSNVFLLVRDY